MLGSALIIFVGVMLGIGFVCLLGEIMCSSAFVCLLVG